MKTAIVVTILLLGLFLNVYKVPLAAKAPYHIFPRSESPQNAKTSPLQLQLHIITSLILLIASTIRYFSPKSQFIRDLFLIFHCLFSLIILPNVSHFGNYYQNIAVLLNGSMLLALQLLYNSPLIYFMILTTPVTLESLYWLYWDEPFASIFRYFQKKKI